MGCRLPWSLCAFGRTSSRTGGHGAARCEQKGQTGAPAHPGSGRGARERRGKQPEHPTTRPAWPVSQHRPLRRRKSLANSSGLRLQCPWSCPGQRLQAGAGGRTAHTSGRPPTPGTPLSMGGSGESTQRVQPGAPHTQPWGASQAPDDCCVGPGGGGGKGGGPGAFRGRQRRSPIPLRPWLPRGTLSKLADTALSGKAPCGR